MLRSYFSALVATLLMLPGFVSADGSTQPSPTGAEEQEKASDEQEESGEQEEKEEDDESVSVKYRGGLRLEASDGSFSARMRWRSQMRVTNLSSGDLAGEDDGIEEEAGFRIQRARFKIDGHAYRPWLKYYLEYGIVRSVMLTLQFDIQPSEKFGVRVGQYKVLFNRERVDSSGAQQFVDRSIVNSPFTLDRQTGPTVMGRLFAGSRADSRYAFGVFTGTGRGGSLEGDKHPMYLGRYQWNFLGRDLPYSQSDIARREEPAASLAFAATSNRGQFTRFSSSGGGQLPGFESGDVDRYELLQWMGEFAYQGRGLSLQGEYHWKRVDDNVEDLRSEYNGWYAQAGYFPHESVNSFPEPLELAVRLARVDTEEGMPLPADRELTLAANWFWNGHNNKLTFDYTYLRSTLAEGSEDTGWRVRLQWDVSF